MLRKRKARISRETLKGIAKSFWEMTPAEKGAKRIDINRKTMQHHYALIRKHVALQRESHLIRFFGCRTLDHSPFEKFLGRNAIAVMGILIRDSEVCLFFPIDGEEEATGIHAESLVYAATPQIFNDLNLDRFIFLSLSRNNDDRSRGERFWIFAREHLKRYRGGFRNNFNLFLREMEFRFNAAGSKEIPSLLNTLDWQI